MSVRVHVLVCRLFSVRMKVSYVYLFCVAIWQFGFQHQQAIGIRSIYLANFVYNHKKSQQSIIISASHRSIEQERGERGKSEERETRERGEREERERRGRGESEEKEKREEREARAKSERRERRERQDRGEREARERRE